MNTKLKRSLLQALMAAAFLLVPLASAQAGTVCGEGPVMSVPPGSPRGTWGQESTCNCGPGTIRGGALASNNTFAWLWSQGTGQVWVQLEMQLIQGAGSGFWWAERAAGGYYFVNGGAGMTDPMQVSYPDYAWTGRYRAVCVR